MDLMILGTDKNRRYRNEFEFQLGHFKDSINLKLEKFSEFPEDKEQGKFLEGYKLVMADRWNTM